MYQLNSNLQTFTVAGGTDEKTDVLGCSAVTFQCTASAGMIVTFKVSTDGTNFTTYPVIDRKTGTVDPDGASVSMSAGKMVFFNVEGISAIEVIRVSGSGTLVMRRWEDHIESGFGTNIVVDSGNGMVMDDDSAFTAGTGHVVPAGFFANQTAPDSVDEGDIGAARITLDRYQLICKEDESSYMRVGGVQVAPVITPIAAASSGENTIVALTSAKKTRCVALNIVAASAVNIYAVSNTGGSVIWGGSTNKINLAANGGLVLPYNPAGWFETAAGHNLIFNLSGAVALSGSITTVTV